MKHRLLLGVFAVLATSAALAAGPPPPQLVIPGSPERTVEAATLLGKDRMDVRQEDMQANVTIFHGTPLLAVLEAGGLSTQGMANERKMAPAIVVATARDGYAVVFSVGELLMHRADPRVFLAAETAQGPLPEREGPVRLVVQGDRSRSAYALARIEVRYVSQNPAERKK